MISPLSPHLYAHYKDLYSLQSDVQMDLISPAETPRSPASLSEKFIHKARLVFFFFKSLAAGDESSVCWTALGLDIRYP